MQSVILYVTTCNECCQNVKCQFPWPDANSGFQLRTYWQFWYIAVSTDFNWDSQQPGMDAGWSFAMQVHYIDCHWVLRQRLNYCEVIVTWSTSLFFLSSCKRVFTGKVLWTVLKRNCHIVFFGCAPPLKRQVWRHASGRDVPFRVKAKMGYKIFSGTSQRVLVTDSAGWDCHQH